MKQSLEIFLSDFKRQGPLPERFVVGYSGGVDSTVLLHALYVSGVPVHALHVNHQLQSKSDDWELHCRSQCEAWGLPFTALRVKVEPGEDGPEAQARLERYRAMFNWMQQHGETVLLCAHHLNDQLETVLLQLLRGSGLRGVAGMRALGPVGVDRHLHPGMLLGRPLLACPKEDLLAYARQHNLLFVEDPSNANTMFRRNWVRHELLPSLEEHFPQSPKAIVQLAEFFQAHYSEQDSEIHALTPRLLSEHGGLQVAAWRVLDESAQLNSLRHWLQQQGVRCGKLKLLELARQLRINKGGIREVEKGWGVKVSRHVATLKRTEP